MQRPLTVPMNHVGHTENSETVVESLNKRQKRPSTSELAGNLTSEPAHSVPGVGRSAHEPQSSTDRDGATMDHDYHGQSVRSVYYKIQSYPTPPICFRIAGEYTLEVPYPKFPELFVPPIIAGFMCRALVGNIHSPQNSDRGQVYTLMLKRLGTDLQASTDRIKSSLENGRVVENQQRYIPNPQYYVPTKYLQGSQLKIAAGEFTNFLAEQISKEAVVTPQLAQTCWELSKTLQCHPDLHNMFVDVSVIKKGGKIIGVKLLLETPQVDRPTLQVQAKYAFAQLFTICYH